MADITYSGVATERRAQGGIVYGKGDAANVKEVAATKSIPSGTAAGSTFKFVRIPANARISGLSEVHWDDLDNSNDTMLSVGLASVDSNITSDDDALTSSLDTSSAGSANLIGDHANFGKRAWEHVSGQSTDPSGSLDLYITTKDHATDVTGDVSVIVQYTLD